jgi:DNA polymerase III alpha subunit (gram-positive type)
MYDEETETIGDTFHEYIRPGKRIPPKVTEITGITEAQVKDARTEMEVLADFYEWLFMQKPTKMVGHNIKSFDYTFFTAKATKYKLILPEMEIVDTLQLARKLSKDGKIAVVNHQQPTIAKFYGIDYRAHSAIEDVKALIRIYEKMGLNTTVKAKRAELGF